MSDTMQSLDQLSALKPATPEAPKYVKKVDKLGRAYATGKRKDAVARVWIKPGAGKIVVNTREVEVYFARPVLRSEAGSLYVPTLPAAPQIGDTFVVKRGCPRTFNGCAEKLNTENYGGFDTLPSETIVR